MKSRYYTFIINLIFITTLIIGILGWRFGSISTTLYNWETPQNEQTENDPFTGSARKTASMGQTATGPGSSVYWISSYAEVTLEVSAELLGIGKQFTVTSWIEAVSDQGLFPPFDIKDSGAPSRNNINTKDKILRDDLDRTYWHDSKVETVNREDGTADAATSYKKHTVSVVHNNPMGQHLPIGARIERDFIHSTSVSAYFSDEITPSELPDLNPFAFGTLEADSDSHVNIEIPDSRVTFATPRSTGPETNVSETSTDGGSTNNGGGTDGNGGNGGNGGNNGGNNGDSGNDKKNGDTNEDGDTDEEEASGSPGSGTTTPTYIADTATRTFVSTNGKYYTTVGSTHEARVTSSVPYASIAWQVEGPDHTGGSIPLTDADFTGADLTGPDHTGGSIPVVETDPGNGTLTTATLRYNIPDDATPGIYKIMPYVWYSDTSARQMSYDLVVTPPEGLRPINGTSYYANSGDTIEMGVVTDSPYASVRWSISPAGDTSIEGPVIETDTAGDIPTVAELELVLASGTPGFRKITAHIFREDGTDYKLTYNMYVY